MSDPRDTTTKSIHGEGDPDTSVAPGDGLGPVNEDEDGAGGLADADVENQAGTEAIDDGKFQRDSAEGEDPDDGTAKD